MTYDQQEWLGLFLVFCVSVICQPKTGTTFFHSQVYSSSECQNYRTAAAHKPIAEFQDTSLKAGLFFGNYFTVVLPGRFRILTAFLPGNHNWPNSVAQACSVQFWVDINISAQGTLQS